MDLIDISLYVADIMLILGIVLAIVLPLIKSLDDPGSLVKSGLGVLAIGGILVVSYLISDGEVSAKFAGDPFNLTPEMSKFIGGCLYATYLLGIISFVAIIYAEISKAVK
jgi:hypothetical protein